MAPVAAAGLLAAAVGTVHAEEPGAPEQDGQQVHTYETGIAQEMPAEAVNEVMTGSATGGGGTANLPDGTQALTVEGEECPTYRWAVSEKQDVLVYNEKWSNFNGTDRDNTETFTTTKDSTWEWHVEGDLSAKVLGLGIDVKGGGGQTFKTTKGVSNTAVAPPHQWLTAKYGAWYTKQTASDLTCIHPDGSEGTHDQGTFEIWLPSGADGWFFTNEPPSKD